HPVHRRAAGPAYRTTRRGPCEGPRPARIRPMTCCVAAIAFSGSKIERADHIRTDPERLAALKSPQAQLLLLDGLVPTLDGANKLAWGGIADAPLGAELVFLGLMNKRGAF